MMANEFSVTRAHVRRKPNLVQKDLNFYKINENIMVSITPLPLEGNEQIKQLTVNDELSHQLKYQIFGGFNNNAIRVDLTELVSKGHEITWIGLMTFTGFQFKYILPSKKEIIFSLADEDAYVYCNKNPCEECVFKCKNGFKLYLYCQEHGLFCTVVSPRNVINHN